MNTNIKNCIKSYLNVSNLLNVKKNNEKLTSEEPKASVNSSEDKTDYVIDSKDDGLQILDVDTLGLNDSGKREKTPSFDEIKKMVFEKTKKKFSLLFNKDNWNKQATDILNALNNDKYLSVESACKKVIG